MSGETLKSFAALHDDYAFFEAHATEVEGTLAAWLPLIRQRLGPMEALDFGSGSGSFTSAFLSRANFAPEDFHLTLVEPDPGFRQQAMTRLQPFCRTPIRAWPLLDRDLGPTFDLIFSHHVLYYVPQLETAIARLVGALRPGGRLLVVQGGRGNSLNQLVWSAFEHLGETAPYNYSENTAQALERLGVDFELQTVRSVVDFPDSPENRQKILRFLLSEHLSRLGSDVSLALFEPYVRDGRVRLENSDELFVVDR